MPPASVYHLLKNYGVCRPLIRCRHSVCQLGVGSCVCACRMCVSWMHCVLNTKTSGLLLFLSPPVSHANNGSFLPLQTASSSLIARGTRFSLPVLTQRIMRFGSKSESCMSEYRQDGNRRHIYNIWCHHDKQHQPPPLGVPERRHHHQSPVRRRAIDIFAFITPPPLHPVRECVRCKSVSVHPGNFVNMLHS
jgi:hypothetical protein